MIQNTHWFKDDRSISKSGDIATLEGEIILFIIAKLATISSYNLELKWVTLAKPQSKVKIFETKLILHLDVFFNRQWCLSSIGLK